MRRSEDGFTIIELIIATAVLSIMLVLVTVLMINIGNLYYKGINQSRVQDSVRNITDSIGDQLKLSDKVPQQATSSTDGHTHAYCIGDKRYTYVLGVQIGHGGLDATGHETNPAYKHVLWQDTNPSPGTCFIDATNSPKPVDLTQTSASSNNNGT
jgi:prepilin-type N-terminal cleavage/methylation domain-containing protein